MNITVFSTTHCGVCHALMQWMDKNNIGYVNKIVDEDGSAMQDFLDVNDGMIGTPFTVIDNEGEITKIAGFDQKRFKQALSL
jgi:glutaredoxin